uniref:AIG1-type G domain-containing protein n=2 Tax=Dicentrarchus labrax TaxID=13489 RepID=A0A8P4GTD2_DICLA
MGSKGSKTVTETDRRIVILGKTGAGKSSLANTIFGKDVFKIDHGLNSTTKKCQAKTRSVNGREITLIDTPGFFDTRGRPEDLEPEIVRCITECAPGLHAFLIVLKYEKFTEQEQDVIQEILKNFTEEVFKYATVVFTHGDQLPKGRKIKDVLRQNKLVRGLVEKCGGRCHVFDNTNWKKNPEDKYRNNEFQVKELLKSIDKMVKENNGSCYTNEMLQVVEEEIQQEEEEIQQEGEHTRLLPPGNMSKKEIREQAKARVFKKLLIRLAGTAAGVVLGALFGVVVSVGVVLTVLRESSKPVQLRGAIAKTAAVVGAGAVGIIGGIATGGAVAAVGASPAIIVTALPAAVGAVVGGVTGYNAAEAADTPWEAAKLAAEAIKNKSQSILDKANDLMDRVS